MATPSSNGHSTASPALEPISAASVGPIATGFAMPPRANDWPRSVPHAAGSPGNLISLMGESPPTQPSSYEDPHQFHSNWSSPRPQIHTPSFLPASPPNPTRRPHSFQLGEHYATSEAPSRDHSVAARRSSLHAHIVNNARVPSGPPPPHQPQAHFYGLPDIDFDLQAQTGMKAGERGYHFGFDSLPTHSTDNGSDANTVITAGYEGGLEVYAVSGRGLELLASLKGLRGGIHRAKILPWLSTGAGSELFPLVAVVMHGPVLRSTSPDTAVQGDFDGQSERPAGSPVPGADLGDRDARNLKTALPVDSYQTSVEVYSLKTGRLVEVLLEAPAIQVKMSIANQHFQAPPPSGALYLKADGGNLVVSSGTTGETWVFRQALHHQNPTIQFRCLGKLWTTLQQPPKPDSTQEADRARLSSMRQGPRTPIVALSGRWIAYCPAAPSSQMALRASVLVQAQGKAPGLVSGVPPQLPSVSADADLPLSESAVNRMMRDATQELISGAKWVGQQGWQALNNYWRGASTPQPPRSPPLGSQPWGNPYAVRQEPVQFPPTHGAMGAAVSKEPGVVSIVDIETLGVSGSVHPVATFSTSLGCSFLSFSPSGLSLFTASTKGDVQTVWDLMRIQHTKSSPLQPSNAPGTPSGPRVRQIAQFSRLTVARVVDVAWTRPDGERLAMVTERGTVHLLDMPASAFTWPPPRRRTRPQGPGSGENPGSAYAYASNALSSAVDAARPLLMRQRRSSANIPQSTGAIIVDHASQGGKMIAAGISHSLGKTSNAINQLRHTRENRVALPSSTGAPGPGCVVWVSRKRYHSLFVLGDGLVRTFPTRVRKSSTGHETGRAPRLNRHKDLKVPGLPADTIAAAVKRFLEPEEYLDLADTGDAGDNTMVLDRAPKPPSQEAVAQSSIPQAEIESSAPYQPFHTDRRVALFEVDPDQAVGTAQPSAVPDLLGDLNLEDRPRTPSSRRKPSKKIELPKADAGPAADGAWVFGQAISCTKLDTGVPSLTEEESLKLSADDTRALPASAMERVLQHVGGGDDQIVVTTRRRRGGGRTAEQDDDGFFEDDCEVLDFADQRV